MDYLCTSLLLSKNAAKKEKEKKEQQRKKEKKNFNCETIVKKILEIQLTNNGDVWR